MKSRKAAGFAWRFSAVLSLLYFLVSSTILTLSSAQGGQSLAITPTRLELHIAGGEESTVKVTLINQGTEEMRLRPQVLGVEVGENGEISLAPREDCAWIRIDPEEIVLAPLSRRESEIKVETPSDAKTGWHRFALAFIQAQEETASIGITGGLAVLLELEVLSATGNARFPFLWLVWVTVAFVAAACFLLATRKFRPGNAATPKSGNENGGGDAP